MAGARETIVSPGVREGARSTCYNVVVGMNTDTSESQVSNSGGNDTAIARARAHGIDVSLLLENLRLSPTARVQQAQAALESVVAIQLEAKRWRESQKRRE